MSDTGSRWAVGADSPVSSVDSEVTLLVFVVGGQLHAVPLDEVEGVARATEIRKVPQPPRLVVGVVDRDDEPVPVIDLAGVLELPSGSSRHVLLHRGAAGGVGFLVEEAHGVGRGLLRPVPPQLRREGGALIGIADIGADAAYLLDLEAAVPAEMRANVERITGRPLQG
jgi:chemotaxis signal transduction protein